MDTKTLGLKAGDKIYVRRFTGWDWHYTEATVVKVTPAGYVDVLIGASTEPMRFRPNGSRIHSSGYHDDYELDSIPYAERKARLEKEQRTKVAAEAVRSIVVSNQGVNFKWGRNGLQAEITRLRGLLDAAQSAVDAI